MPAALKERIMPKQIKKSAQKSTARTSRSAKKVHELMDISSEQFGIDQTVVSIPPKSKSGLQWSVVLLGLLFIVAVYAASKGYIIAAIVNGSPVFRWDVNRMLETRYGQQTLESMISEKMIGDAAVKQGVVITQKDIDAKTAEVVKSLGPNVKLDDLLKYQGMNKSDFEHQISLQLTVERILGKDVNVTDTEINDFIEKNKETLVATDEAGMRGEAREALTSQKINEKIQPWFASLKQNAKVVRLMK